MLCSLKEIYQYFPDNFASYSMKLGHNAVIFSANGAESSPAVSLNSYQAASVSIS